MTFTYLAGKGFKIEVDRYILAAILTLVWPF